MKRIPSLILAFLMLTAALAGCSSEPSAVVDSTDESTGETTPAETTAAKAEIEYTENQIAAMSAFSVEYDGFTLQFDAPAVAYYGKETDDAWGQHAFPYIYHTADGLITLSWQYGEDKVGGTMTSFSKATANGGKSWVPAASTTGAREKLMPDGKYFSAFLSKGTTQKFSTAKYTPALSWGSYKMFFAEDFKDDESAGELGIINLTCRVYNPDTKQDETIESVVNWPYAPITVHPGGITYTLSGVFGLNGSNVICTEDGTLYVCIYCNGFDSFASSREDAVNSGVEPGKSCVYVFESTDSAHTWNLVAQMLPTAERAAKSVNWKTYTDHFEGFDEPKMIEMPDGSFLMLMRSGASRTLFVTRSTDNCRTWTEPEAFDELGVLPQLLKLDCGVTLASYGRPELRMRATSDPTGVTWEDSVKLPTAAKDGTPWLNTSCFYTSMVAVDANTAIVAYTDFQYPNKDGVPVHTVLTRRVTVVMHEDAE